MADQLFWGSDIFAIYPKTLRELLQTEDLAREREGFLQKDCINLPSDFEWKQKVYFRLLEQQKKINAALDRGEEPPDEIKPKKEQWDPNFDYVNIAPVPPPTSLISVIKKKKRKCIIDDIIGFLDISQVNLWGLEDYAKAGKLLSVPPKKCVFIDEQEMRRVYSLIYDVFRYKHVLSQALNDGEFFVDYENHKIETQKVWLLLFDLYLRHFLSRDPEETAKKDALFKEANLLNIESCLWESRVKLAASISRLRIKNRALLLSQLLPIHLQDEKVAICAANPMVCGWMNPFKTKKQIFATENLNSLQLYETPETDGLNITIKINEFKWDKMLPQFLTCIPKNRSKFVQADMIKNHEFIMQDRAFSLGPAIFSRLLDVFEVHGTVIQTHVFSPKSTAYLASLFLTNNLVINFIAFGAGIRVHEYQNFMKQLGVNNVEIRSENFRDISMNSSILDRVVGVFATPPNSYSGVSDPIDLICSRGGDLTMLEVLTESEISDDARKRVKTVLEEQRETLRLAMSRPQVQYILYETHSIVDSENEKMVTRSVEDVNNAAREKHLVALRERIRLEAIALAAQEALPSIMQLDPSTPVSSSRKRGREEVGKKHKSDDDSSDSDNEDGIEFKKTTEEDFEVPLTDLFEISELPDICLNQDKCLNPRQEGVFFALLKRKEVTRLDAKYMIKIAETRGVFGNTNLKLKSKVKITNKKPEKKIEIEEKSNRKFKRKKSEVEILIKRLSQPTHSFITRTNPQRRSSAEYKMLVLDPNRCPCMRHSRHEEFSELSKSSPLTNLKDDRAKNWWKETTKFVQRLQGKKDPFKERTFDDIVEALRKEKLPPLRLSRNYRSLSERIERIPYPLSVSLLEFQKNNRYYHCSLLDDPRPHTVHGIRKTFKRHWTPHSSF